MLIQSITVLVCFQLIYANDEPIVEISNGKLLGVAHENYYSFEGIPYAEPPIGENRFESPKPYLKKWTTIRNVTKLQNHCIQNTDRISVTYEINGSEDCLYLNIYTPNIKSDNVHLYPVIFFIHRGGFMFGNGDILREQILMKSKKVILVTMNYRLNIFGFLSTGDKEITGNMGLKDQLLALKWVKNNIRSFNGDPKQILLTGFSAGSASVEYLTLTKDIDTLINGAFGMSGSVLNDWAFNPDPKPSSIKVGEFLNCPTDNSIDLKKCLKIKSANDIVKIVEKFRNFLGSSIGIFAPVVEDESVIDAIITKEPRQLLKMGKFSKKPFLASYTAEDGGIFIASMYGDISKIIRSKNIHFLSGEPWLYENNNSDKWQNIFDELEYRNVGNLTKLFTDRIFKNGIIETLNLRRHHNDSKTYSYLYDNRAIFSLSDLIVKDTNFLTSFGTDHGDDVFLMFNFPPRDVYEFNNSEEKISNNFVIMLESLAKTGIPKFGDIEIPKITEENFNYLHIKEKDYHVKIFET